MTQKEFDKLLDTLTDITDVQYAYECWASLTDKEKVEHTVDDILADIQGTYEALAEMED
jgi:hypothetical protein